MISKLLSVLLILTRRAPRSLSWTRHYILGLGFLANVYHDGEQRAADRKQAGANIKEGEKPAVKHVTKVDVLPHNSLS